MTSSLIAVFIQVFFYNYMYRSTPTSSTVHAYTLLSILPTKHGKIIAKRLPHNETCVYKKYQQSLNWPSTHSIHTHSVFGIFCSQLFFLVMNLDSSKPLFISSTRGKERAPCLTLIGRLFVIRRRYNV